MQSTGQIDIYENYTLNASVVKIMGKHTIKVGGETTLRNHSGIGNFAYYGGYFVFSPHETAAPNGSRTQTTSWSFPLRRAKTPTCLLSVPRRGQSIRFAAPSTRTGILPYRSRPRFGKISTSCFAPRSSTFGISQPLATPPVRSIRGPATGLDMSTPTTSPMREPVACA